VVGVVSAKLAGERISNVGFAVPVNEAMRMLRANNVRFTVSRAVERRDGPALVRSVSPAVGLVTVTPDPEVGEDVSPLRVAPVEDAVWRWKRSETCLMPARPSSGNLSSELPVTPAFAVPLKSEMAWGDINSATRAGW